MVIVKTQRFELSEAVLQLPSYAAEHLVMTGLTAAQMRLALPLVCWARANGDTVVIEKPMLEKLSGVLLDSTDRLLKPLTDATLDLPGDPLDGEPVFEQIAYDPGVRGKQVGRVLAELSVGMGHFLSRGRPRNVRLPADEIRQYRSVSAITMRMRLGAALELAKEATSVSVTLRAEDVSAFFGSTYGRVAVIKRPSAITGEVVEHVSLSRAGSVLVMPAVEEIAATSQMMKPVAKVAMDGRKWTSIEITAKRLTVRDLTPKPKPKPPTVTGIRQLTKGRPTRAVVKSVDA